MGRQEQDSGVTQERAMSRLGRVPIDSYRIAGYVRLVQRMKESIAVLMGQAISMARAALIGALSIERKERDDEE